MIADLFPRLLPLLLVLAATFVYAGVTAGANAYQIERGYNVSHLWETRERLVAVAGFVLLAYAPRGIEHWWNALTPLLAAGACACLFGLRFDIRLNMRRLLPRHYLGTDPQTAATDKRIRARGLTGRTFAWLKLAGVVVLAAAALLLSGCRTGRDAPAGIQAEPAVAAATVPRAQADREKGTGANPANQNLPTPTRIGTNPAAQTVPTPPAPDAPGWQHRQYRRNLKAQPRTVPLIQGRAAVNAPLATSVVAAYKPEGPIVQADSGSTVQVATAAKNAQAAAGEGNVQQRTDVAATPWWRTLLNWWPAVALAGVAVWFFWPAILALLRRMV